MKTEFTLELFLESLKFMLPVATSEFKEAMENLRNEDPEKWSSMTEEEWVQQFKIYLDSAFAKNYECVGNCGDCSCG